MTDQQILERAIEKAINRGWKFFGEYEINSFKVKRNDIGGDYCISFYSTGDGDYALDVNQIIFSHGFAKALWPKDGLAPRPVKETPGTPLHARRKPYSASPARPLKGSWQYHLQCMVIANDPIKYLGENL